MGDVPGAGRVERQPQRKCCVRGSELPAGGDRGQGPLLQTCCHGGPRGPVISCPPPRLLALIALGVDTRG